MSKTGIAKEDQWGIPSPISEVSLGLVHAPDLALVRLVVVAVRLRLAPLSARGPRCVSPLRLTRRYMHHHYHRHRYVGVGWWATQNIRVKIHAPKIQCSTKEHNRHNNNTVIVVIHLSGPREHKKKKKNESEKNGKTNKQIKTQDHQNIHLVYTWHSVPKCKERLDYISICKRSLYFRIEW